MVSCYHCFLDEMGANFAIIAFAPWKMLEKSREYRGPETNA
jgi:hypothetical protein